MTSISILCGLGMYCICVEVRLVRDWLSAFCHECLPQDTDTDADGDDEDNANDSNDDQLHRDSCNCRYTHIANTYTH